ncbi:hypothetical protein ACIRD6_37030 [Streptomyces sp. NPDC102473]|uniref:hypothetical protein n=1 Tax=Streptomyces sp. NPDC102473 TaxID=3366180 RepID=UPI003802AA6A
MSGTLDALASTNAGAGTLELLASANGGATFLDHTLSEWRVALVAAAVAAVAYEATLALLRRSRPAARWVTLRIPFLILLLARLMVPRSAWQEMKLNAELWDVLQNDEGSAVGNWLTGMRFSLSMVMGGAIRTAKAWELPGRTRRRQAPAPVGKRQQAGAPLMHIWAALLTGASVGTATYLTDHSSTKTLMYWMILAVTTAGIALLALWGLQRRWNRKRE